MTDLKSDEDGIRDPGKEAKEKSKKTGGQTSRNREEGMTEAGEESFQRSDTSGTTGLGGESPDSDSVRGPGGVEGTGGDS